MPVKRDHFVNFATLQNTLQDSGLDGWLLYDFRGSNPVALHLAGLRSSGSRRWFLWLPAQGAPTLLIHAIEASTFVGVNPELRAAVDSYVGWRQMEEKLAALVRADGRRPRIAMEYSPANAVPYVSLIDAGAKELVEAATGAEIVSSADLVQLAQAVLSPAQVASHRRAAEVCLAAKDHAFEFIHRGLRAGRPISEYDVQQAILEFFAAHDLDPDHPPIVAVNAHAADPHYAPTAERHSPIGPSDAVLIDLWGRTRTSPDDCFADLTWTAYCGAEIPPDVERVFALVAAARDEAVAFIQARLDAGEPVYGYEVDDAARAVIEDGGFGEAFIHRTGHSLGSELHFRGVNIDNLETQDRRRLVAGVMFTVEPGIYLPDYVHSGGRVGLGIRSEINCLMHADRVEVTTLPLQDSMIPLLAGAL